MRIFTAIRLPDAVREELTGIQPKHSVIRLTPVSQLHLTLRFIGEMDKARTRRVTQVLSQVSFPPFDITLMGTGCFPNPTDPYVLWTGVQFHPVLRELYDAIEEELLRAGVPHQSRSFHPHVTLGRIKKTRSDTDNADTPPLSNVMDAFLNGEAKKFMSSFHVDRFQLYHSRLHSGGAIHHCLQEYPAM